MERAGAHIAVAQADVSDPEQLEALLASIRRTTAPLGGIIHAAGVLDDGFLPNQTWTRFDSVLKPKVAGAWNLHRLTENLPLDFLILFSSSAALLGGPGQGSYAAANAFLDALAAYRRSLGLPATSIGWGPWAEGGMAERLSCHVRQQRAEHGWAAIAPEQGLNLLARILRQDVEHIAVLPLDWSKYMRQFADSDLPPFLSMLGRRDRASEAPPQIASTQSDPWLRMESVSPKEQLVFVMEYVRREAARALGADNERLAADRPLMELGLDSLMALEMRSRISDGLKVSVPMVQLLGGSIEQVATMLLQKRFGRPSPLADHGSSAPRRDFDREPRPRSEVPASGALTRNDVEPEGGEL
jgi:NAD(P)-dependent dehydrogenase (short-subunit alcohol dehydrogenase family)/acyl carrier protein